VGVVRFSTELLSQEYSMTSQGKYFKFRKDFLAKDLVASVVVFLVALPLCMGIAIASGVPPAAGLITGIVGGLIVGTLSGAPLQVSGPAAGLTVLVWQLVQKFSARRSRWPALCN
jgi:MFS superfamily sulfate permease-like transporter